MTRRVAAILAVALGFAGTSLLVPAPGSATVGIDDYPARLKNAAQDSVADPWNFWNRECTSFVAWRVNNDGSVPFHNYYLGVHWGNASNWKAAATSVGVDVDNTPVAGAIAWWAAGSPGSSRGHVAFVEEVNSGSITIEEYNWVHRGGYSVRTIASSDSKWPSGFIHLGDLEITNTVVPTVAGTPQVGKHVRADVGTWSPSSVTYEYQWLADGVPISNATDKKLAVDPALLGRRLKVQDTASLPGLQSVDLTSAASDAVAPGKIVAKGDPVVTGKPQVGVALTATTGHWTKEPTDFGYQWYAADDPIAGATAGTFTPTADQLGKAVTVAVTAARPGYTGATAASKATADVAAGVFSTTTAPTLSGTPQVGETLTADPGAWTPDAAFAYQWLADGTPVDGADSASYPIGADDLGHRLAVQVTATQAGYTTATTTTAPTAKVSPGTFRVGTNPSIAGVPQVGESLSADPGQWTPSAAYTFQWYAATKAISGATSRTWTPTATEVGKVLTVKVTGTRDGYLPTTIASGASKPVALGAIAVTEPPAVEGAALVGQELRVAGGTWSIAEPTLTYQWWAGRSVIKGATKATYFPTAADLGHPVSVVVTATAPGYTPLTMRTERTVDVLAGAIEFAKPRILGHPWVGETVTADLGTLSPSTADVRYQWFLGHTPIARAHDATYRVQPGDLGHPLRVEVAATQQDWAPLTRHAPASAAVRTLPRVHLRTWKQSHHPVVRLIATAPGLPRLRGHLKVLDGDTLVARAPVVAGRATRVLRDLKVGRHELTVVYRWPGQVVRVAIPLIVHVRH